MPDEIQLYFDFYLTLSSIYRASFGPTSSAISRYDLRWAARSSQSFFAIRRPPKGPTVSTISTRRSEEHTSELQSLMRISYAVFCLKKKIKYHTYNTPSNRKIHAKEVTYTKLTKYQETNTQE